jgi:hypothetical protein
MTYVKTPERIAAHTKTCLRCLGRYTPYGEQIEFKDEQEQREWFKEFPPPALSRWDNKTYICSQCGQDEAILDFTGEPLPGKDEWPL